MFFQGKNWPWCESNQLGDREYKVVKGTCWKLSWPWISSSRNLSWPWIRSCGNLSLLPTANTNWYQIYAREIIPSEQTNQPNCIFFSFYFWQRSWSSGKFCLWLCFVHIKWRQIILCFMYNKWRNISFYLMRISEDESLDVVMPWKTNHVPHYRSPGIHFR